MKWNKKNFLIFPSRDAGCSRFLGRIWNTREIDEVTFIARLFVLVFTSLSQKNYKIIPVSTNPGHGFTKRPVQQSGDAYQSQRGSTPVLLLLFGIIVASVGYLAATGGLTAVDKRWQKQQESPKQEVARVFSRSGLLAGAYSGPFVTVVQLDAGTFAYATVRHGVVVNGAFVGDVTMQYINSELGVVPEDRGYFDTFLTKSGGRKRVRIAERLITGVTLPDGTIVPVRLVYGTIADGQLVGEFRLRLYQEKLELTGNRDARGNAFDISVNEVPFAENGTMAVISREILKLALTSQGLDQNVLGVSTDTQAVVATNAEPFSLPVIQTGIIAEQDEEAGVVRISTPSYVTGSDALTQFVQSISQGDTPAETLTQLLSQLSNAGSVTSLVGPTGATGAAGSDGLQGATGPQGAQGDAGSDGPTGAQDP